MKVMPPRNLVRLICRLRIWTLNNPEIVPVYDHHLCIQLDAFRNDVAAPVRMYVDWVRIYRDTAPYEE